MDKRIVFMGSPDFALPTLRALQRNYAVVGVVTQPDRRAGRGRSLAPPPVKVLALEFGLPVIQPVRLREPQAVAQLGAWAPDLIVVAAFGQILRQDVLDLPQYGCINVHASLLPRWRGASPLHHAILSGDEKTGVTIMQMDAGLDTGPMLAQSVTPILPADTTGLLSERLADLGAELLIETLPGYLDGKIIPLPQPETGSTYAPMLKKADGLLEFSRPAIELERQVRAFNPWPGAYFAWDGVTMKVHQARAEKMTAPAGQRLVVEDLPAVGTGDGILVLETVQPTGKSTMPGGVYLRGARGWVPG